MAKETLTEKLEKKISKEVQDKYWSRFEKESRFLGNGVYAIQSYSLYSTQPRELFLMFCARLENIKIPGE